VRLFPFRALRPVPDLVSRVAAPPYDVVDIEQARRLAAGNPFSFLHVSRAEIDLPAGTDPYSEAVYEHAATVFREFVRRKFFVRELMPCIYVYLQQKGSHRQFGLVGCCHTDDYVDGTIRRHELTRVEKEADRARHTKAVAAQGGPVFLMYRGKREIDALVESAVAREKPLYDFTDEDGVRHAVWRAPDPAAVEAAFREVPRAYIADGHHRAAAYVKTGTEMKAANPAHRGDEPYNRFLAVAFSAAQLRILPYHRCVRDLGGLSGGEFLERLEKAVRVERTGGPPDLSDGECGMFFGGSWHRIVLPVPQEADPVSRLESSILQDRVLGPILGIRDPRSDQRIGFAGGVGPSELERLAAGGEAAVAFAMRPVSVEQVMAVADAGLVMPPKSTWFDPKLRSGLLIHTLS